MDPSEKTRDRPEKGSILRISSKNYLDVDRLKLKRSPDSRTTLCPIEASTPLESEHRINSWSDHEIDLTPIVWKTPKGDRVVLRSIKNLDEDDNDEDSFRTANQSSIRFKSEINQNSSPINKNYVKAEKTLKKENLSVTFQNHGHRLDKNRVVESVAAGKKVARHQSFPSRIPVRILPRKPLADKPVPNPNIASIASKSLRPPSFTSKPIDIKKLNQNRLQSKGKNTNGSRRRETRAVTSRRTSNFKTSRFEPARSQTSQRQCDKYQRIETNKTKSSQVKRLAKKKRLTEPMSPKLLTAVRAALRQQIIQASSSESASCTKSSLSLSERKIRSELLREALKDSAVVNFKDVKKMSKLNSY